MKIKLRSYIWSEVQFSFIRNLSLAYFSHSFQQKNNDVKRNIKKKEDAKFPKTFSSPVRKDKKRNFLIDHNFERERKREKRRLRLTDQLLCEARSILQRARSVFQYFPRSSCITLILFVLLDLQFIVPADWRFDTIGCPWFSPFLNCARVIRFPHFLLNPLEKKAALSAPGSPFGVRSSEANCIRCTSNSRVCCVAAC